MALSSDARTVLGLVRVDDETGEVIHADLERYVEAFGVDDEYTAEELLDEVSEELVQAGIWGEYPSGGYYDIETAEEAEELEAMEEEADRAYLADIDAAWNDAKGIW